MIKLDNIKNSFHLVGKTLRNKTTNEVHFVENLHINKYFNSSDPIRFRFINDQSVAFISGTKEEVLKQLLNFEVVR
ncbi:hypothetical protein [Pseudostreptobacillus hongkongensis]|uniref:hypothetical protein n=1 Tax=Pseudostreptobacillus hongkongensis TaxID=1162717 RepID=UPI00082CE26B|nr:hypothetical protein [Pseudostreptobacillus hongkongensis]